MAEHRVFFFAIHRNEIVGCTSYVEGRNTRYLDHSGSMRTVEGVYLCSSEVLPRFRGFGIGGLLYRRRLRECQISWPSAVLEVLGTGSPRSVHHLAMPGFSWHLSRGFHVIGHSCDEDLGPVLRWASS
ncbi:GNAT family N-acetyltransferase [Herbidospora mongoliensis]|uniref:GNAT family N-acetyltransferase n=1 Tax=Herbidospora mongoliensis TaxID=688067 RepID=UPI0034E2C79B